MGRTHRMYAATCAATLAAAALAVACSNAGQAAPGRQTPPASATLARGRYLVDAVGVCGDCHTPRLPSGAPDMKRYLRGAELDFAPVHPIPGWSSRAGDITAEGMSGYSVNQLADIMQGKVAFAPPMPTYRLSRADALAVATYLKSIKPAPKPLDR